MARQMLGYEPRHRRVQPTLRERTGELNGLAAEERSLVRAGRQDCQQPRSHHDARDLRHRRDQLLRCDAMKSRIAVTSTGRPWIPVGPVWETPSSSTNFMSDRSCL